MRTNRVESLVAAGVGVRLLARAVDFTVVSGIGAVGSLIPGSSETATATAVSISLVAIAVSIAEACLLRWWGRTPGQALLGLHTVTATGRPVPFLRGVVRASIVWIAIMVGGIVSGIAGAVILVVAIGGMIGPMLIRPDHRGLHDLITGTVVVGSSVPSMRGQELGNVRQRA